MTDFDVDEMVIWTSPRTHEQISMSFRGKTGLTFCALYNMKTGMQVIAPLSEVDHDWHQMCETEETKHAQTRTELAYTLQERNEYLLRAESAEACLRELEAENAELKRQLEQAQRAMTLADVSSLEELGNWVVGAQSEIANLAGQLRDIWDMQAAYMRGEVPIDKITIGYVNDAENETPFGQQLDGLGDEVEP